MIHILMYIKSAPVKRLLYEDIGNIEFVGSSDVDWAGSPSYRKIHLFVLYPC